MFSVRLSVALLGCTALACGEAAFGSDDLDEPTSEHRVDGLAGSSGSSGRAPFAGTSGASGSSGAASLAGQAGAAGGQAGVAGSQATDPVGGQAGVGGGQAGAASGGQAGASGEAGAASGGQAGSEPVGECVSDADCAGAESPCQVAVCTAEHTCATKLAAAGKVVSTVNDGCTILRCDDQGNLQTTVPTQGTTCGNGGFCNDVGTCGECVPGINRCVDGGHQSLCPADGHWTAPVSCGGMPCGAESGECVGVQEVSVGNAHACALLADGTVRCWGKNSIGQLGPAPVAGHEPREVPGLKDVVKVTTGNDFSCALTKTGSVSCWGAADMGQLGVAGAKTGTMQTIEGWMFSDLSSSGQHSCGVLPAGMVACWGDNSMAQSGGGAAVAPMPYLIQGWSSGKPIQSLLGALRVVTGDQYGCALLPDLPGDRVFCWGDNSHSQITKGGGVSGLAFDVTKGGTTKPISSFVGGPMSMSFSFDDPGIQARRTMVWGKPDVVKGASTSTYQVQPWFQGQEAHDVALGSSLSAVVSPGEISFYGNNFQGLFGNGTTSGLKSNEGTLHLPGAEHVALGGKNACAWNAAGQVWCWGFNNDGIVVPSFASGLLFEPTLLAW